MIKEFREFAIKGNVVDLAVGFVLGVAFAAVVTSLVENVLTPLIAAVFEQPDFSALTIGVGDSEIRYGSFLNAIISFLLVALALFLFVVKPYNSLNARLVREPESVPVEPPQDIVLLTEIRDTLRRQ
ncbi:MAG TPA: large conductance mechanosensitive channel protein MscL [Acidimicrobiia bacterium]|nr:large conductance mechanosensitive channel protein MscL [Acidimicrobiia bacterium]